MEITTEITAGVAIIKLANGVTSTVGDELAATVNQLLDDGHRAIVLNLERVVYIDSAGLGNIVNAYSAVHRRGGKLRVEGLNRRLRHLFGFTKMTEPFGTTGYLFPDPFHPRLRDVYWKVAIATGGLILIIMIAMIVLRWGR